MPRDGAMIWCDRCGIFLAPLGKKPRAGERAAEVLTDTVMVCVKCAKRHGITAENCQPVPTPEPAPAPAPATPTPAPAPAAVVAVDPAQAALDALPAWIKEDGARHGHNRLKAAVAEVERLSAPSAEPAANPAPVAKDIKEAPKPSRPVKRPARPRREPVPDPTREPAAEVARRNREAAAAYARKHGTDMAPPARRPIVTADEIRSGMRALPPAEDGTPPSYHPDVVLDRWEAAKYVGHTIRTFDRYTHEGRIPTVEGAKRGHGFLVADLDNYRAGRPARPRPQPKPKPAARQATVGDRMASARGVAAKLKREQAVARVEKFGDLLRQGTDPETAATEAGYASLHLARQACRRLGREDVRQLIPDGRRRTELQERAA